MHHTNAAAPAAGFPFGAVLPDQTPRPDAAPEDPPAAKSGYEQILAARAALRAETARAATLDKQRSVHVAPAPAKEGPGQPRRGAKFRRAGLVLSGLVAAPVCGALLSLAWDGPSKSAAGLLAASASVARTPAASRLGAGCPVAALAPSARADAPVFAAEGAGDAPPRTAGSESGAPHRSGPPDPKPGGTEQALADPEPDQAWHPVAALLSGPEGIRPMLAAGGPEPERAVVVLAALDHGAAVPATVAEPDETPGRGARPLPASGLAAGWEGWVAPGPVAAAGTDEPTAGSGGAGAAPVAVAQRTPGEEPAAPAARPATPVDIPPLPPWVRPEPRPRAAPAAAQPAAAPAAAAPAPPPTSAAAATAAGTAALDGLPPLPPWVRAPPENTRTGAPAPPVRAVRASEGGGSPSTEARCRAINVKLQLGEDMSNAERAFLQSSCGAKRR